MAAADKVVGLVAIKVPIKKGPENLLAEKILRKQNIHFLSNDVFEQQGKAKNKV